MEHSKQARQLSLHLRPENPFSLKYFIPHSGVFEAYQALESIARGDLEIEIDSTCTYLYGLEGVGKTHLLSALFSEQFFFKRALAPSEEFSRLSEESEETVLIIDAFESANISTAQFISMYEKARSSHAMLIIAGRVSPYSVSTDPHITSRLLSNRVIELKYPKDEELLPIVKSLLEKNNLMLSKKNLDYLLKTLPPSPLSFANILGSIDSLCLESGRPAKRNIIKQVIEKDLN